MSANELGVVRIQNVSHRYGNDWALRNIDIACDTTGVVGLLGANGAGKSTLMNIVCGVLYQSEGVVTVYGNNTRHKPLAAKRLLGFLPQQVPVHPELTVDEYLGHCAALRRIPTSESRGAVENAKRRCGLSNFANRLIANLSGGYRQRVGIAQAIIHRPKVVVLDEPMNGLDPNQIIEMRKLIGGLSKGCLVLLSSHILSDIELLCSRIVMLNRGRLVFDGTMEEFKLDLEPRRLKVRFGNAPNLFDLEKLRGIRHAEMKELDGLFALDCDFADDAAESVVAASVKHNWQLREMYLERPSLEDSFARHSTVQSVA